MQHDRYGMDSMRIPPVKEGNTYKVIVPGAQVGEELDVKINKVTRRVAFGEKIGEEQITQPEESTE
jgi:predicted RNA-binding protein with TRAM domain